MARLKMHTGAVAMANNAFMPREPVSYNRRLSRDATRLTPNCRLSILRRDESTRRDKFCTKGSLVPLGNRSQVQAGPHGEPKKTQVAGRAFSTWLFRRGIIRFYPTLQSMSWL